MVALDHVAQGLDGQQRLPVAGVHVPDLPLGHRDERLAMHAILPRKQPPVHSAAQQPRLEAGLAIARDDAPLAERAPVRPVFLDDADGAVRDVPQAEEPGEEPSDQREAQDDEGRADRQHGFVTEWEIHRCG